MTFFTYFTTYIFYILTYVSCMHCSTVTHMSWYNNIFFEETFLPIILGQVNFEIVYTYVVLQYFLKIAQAINSRSQMK